MSRTARVLAAAAALTFAAGAASAQQAAFTPKHAGSWVVDLRVTDIIPQADSKILTAAGADTGLKVDGHYDVMPTLGISYFVTDNIALDLTLGSTRHAIHAVGPATDLLVRDQWVLPPVLTLQYHPLPEARLSPYVGGGVNYMMFYSGHNAPGFVTDLKNGFGAAVQGGLDYAIQGPWTLNVDAKKVFFKTDANITTSPLGALHSRVNLDPWVISAGVGRRF